MSNAKRPSRKLDTIRCRRCKERKARADFAPDKWSQKGTTRHALCSDCRAYNRETKPASPAWRTVLVDPRYREKSKARWILYASKGYKVTDLPCWLCGSFDGVVRHHPDYDKPLSFVPLCGSCHKFIHEHRCGTKTKAENYTEYVTATNALSRDVSTNERDVLQFSPSTTRERVTESRA